MKIIHIMADGTIRDSIEGVVIQSEQFYQVINGILEKQKDGAKRSKPDIIDRNAVAYISKETIRNSQTFPQDYDFGSDSYSAYGYICGMSVPPLMIKRIVTRLIEAGVFEN